MITYTEKIGGRKLYNVLRRDMGVSLTMVRRLKWSGALFVNGESAHTDYILAPGDVVTADVEGVERKTALVPQEGPLGIIYEDEGLLAVVKPTGMLTHPSRSRYDGTLSNYVSGYLLRTSGSGVCHAANRLDRDTGGIVLFAKNAHYQALACAALAAESAVKEYSALVMGRPVTGEGVIDLPIRRLSGGSMMRTAAEEGQRAVTKYSVIKTGEICGAEVSMLRLRLLTGRTHQIRVHCLASGCPVLGDLLYRTEESLRFSERLGVSPQALWAERLAFYWQGREIFLNAPAEREDMKKIAASLKDFS